MDKLLDYIIEAYYKIRRRGIRPISLDWDEKLNTLINEGEIVYSGRYTIIFKHQDKYFDVWTGNFPYGYGDLYRVADVDDLSPHNVLPLEYATGWTYISQKYLPKASTTFKLRELEKEYDRRNFNATIGL